MWAAIEREAAGIGFQLRRARLAATAAAVALVATVHASAQSEAPPEAEATAAAQPASEPVEAQPEEPPPAPRSGPHTANSIQLGLGFRYGVLLSDGDLNPWGTGLGIDVGYTLPNAIYFGGGFEYFFGDSSEALGFKVSTNIWQLSAEGGYDIGLGENFVIRPKLGFGLAHIGVSVENCPSGFTCSEDSKSKAAIAPGLTLMLFTRQFSLSIDTRYDMVLTDPSLRGLIFSVGIGF